MEVIKTYVDKDMILSPGVKDYFKEKMITLIYGEKQELCEEKVLWKTISREIKRYDNKSLEISIYMIKISRADFKNWRRLNNDQWIIIYIMVLFMVIEQ